MDAKQKRTADGRGHPVERCLACEADGVAQHLKSREA
jgi:hypothetical protein